MGEEGRGGGVVGGGVIGDMGSSVKYRSCLHAEEDDIRELVHFWVSSENTRGLCICHQAGV